MESLWGELMFDHNLQKIREICQALTYIFLWLTLHFGG